LFQRKESGGGSENRLLTVRNGAFWEQVDHFSGRKQEAHPLSEENRNSGSRKQSNMREMLLILSAETAVGLIRRKKTGMSGNTG
jgi:hypothetical protein